MNSNNRYLTGFLLLLIGILMGGAFVMFQQGDFIKDHSSVQFTEVKRSEKPLFSDDDLEKMDARFLFKTVAQQTIPTVVYISTVIRLGQNEEVDNEDDSFWNNFRSHRARTIGSGVIVSKNGYIVTNNHVIDGAIEDEVSVMLNDKRAFEARIVGTDPTTDLAVIKIDAHDLPAITIGNSDKVEVGEWVLAVGNPFRLRSTVTAGIVSALSRQVRISGESDSRLRIDSFIQTDAAINKGNSGGALVNTSGELVGINTAIATENGNYQGYGFAVPANLVRKVMGDIIEYGKVHRALLGVSISSVNYLRARELGLNTIKGVEIQSISPDGAAAKANLKKNDIILTVNGQAVNESNELQEKIAVHQPGDVVRLKVWRNHKTITREVTLGQLDASQLAAGDRNFSRDDESSNLPEGRENRGLAFGSFSMGFKVMGLSTPEDPDKYDLIIMQVYPSSEAAEQGLREGYIIREVNGEAVTSIDALKKLFSKGDENSFLMKIETPEGAIGYYDLKK